eukprot:m.234401 g.234401  ORF g.234401 m.234401 type:complete len:438 (+) comp19591_c0_seq1:198-1511(+)
MAAAKEYIHDDGSDGEHGGSDDLDSSHLPSPGPTFDVDEELAPEDVQEYQGFLWKKGGKKGTWDWARRWCVLSSKGLCYFKQETDVQPCGLVQLHEMLELKLSQPGKGASPRKFRFELVTAGRTYYFSAESSQDMGAWLNVLATCTTSRTRQLASKKFDFENCTITGFLHKTGGSSKTYHKRWCALLGRKLYYFLSNTHETPKDFIDLTIVSAITEEEQANTFHLVTPKRTYDLRADTLADMQAWLAALRALNVFGNALPADGAVPRVVTLCTTFVEQHGADVEGIYRIPGSVATINALCTRVDQDVESLRLDPEHATAHDVASLLKQYFRDLPEPLIPAHIAPRLAQAALVPDHNASLYAVQAAAVELPPTNFATLKYMCAHLSRVSEQSETNRMSVENLAVVFSPTFFSLCGDMRGNLQCMRLLIQYHEWIFASY